MQYSVDSRTVRSHDVSGDLPPKFEAVIALKGSTDAEPVTMADFRNLLTTAVNQLGIPTTALMGLDVTLAFRWS